VIIIGILKTLIIIGLLALIHEFGHYIIARIFDVKVLKFAVGIGPKLYSKKVKETEYSIRAFPIGGFVQMDGELEDNSPRSFSSQSPYKRIAILSGGILMNILFALIIYLFIYTRINYFEIPKVSSNNDLSYLENFNLNIDDEILKINNKTIYNANDVYSIIQDNNNDNFRFVLKDKKGNKETHDVIIPKTKIGQIGVMFENLKVVKVFEDSPANKVGIKEGSVLKAINDIEYDNIEDYLRIIKANPDKTMKMSFDIDGNIEEYNISIASKMIREFNVDFVVLSNLPFIQNLYYSFNETKAYIREQFTAVGELFFGGKDSNVEVSGVVGTGAVISSAKSLLEILYIMSAISFSLGIMNLLPIPGLDGGKILFTIIEIINHKKISIDTQVKYTVAGFVFLIAFMIVVTFKDISNLL